MSSSGRCHGPGCRETADGDFCSERCSTTWQAQFWRPEQATPPRSEWSAARAEVLRRASHGCSVHPITDHVAGVSLAEVARNVPGMQSALTSAAMSFANLGGAADEVRRQDERLRAAFWPRERADEAIVEARELARTSTLTYQQAVDKVIDDDARARADRFASANAEFPQVASIPDPSRGWLARTLDRLFGRTT